MSYVVMNDGLNKSFPLCIYIYIYIYIHGYDLCLDLTWKLEDNIHFTL